MPGLAAKLVIDIMVGVSDLNSSRPCIDLLASLDYCYLPYRAETMHWFCKPSPGHRTHHLHLVPTDFARFANVLVFRDYLREHPEAATAYESLKRDLAARHTDDREAYTEGKSRLIAELTDRAHRWAATCRG